MDGLKKILRKVAGPVLAVGAVAAGQPQLAVAAYQAGNAATAKKKKAPAVYVEPTPEVTPSLFSSLTTSDRNALLIGGGVLAGVLLLKSGRRK